MIIYLLIDVIIAYILDLIFGDPNWIPHPVRFIGWIINKSERVLIRKADGNAVKERIAGILLALFVVTITFLLVYAVLKIAMLVNVILFHVINIYFIYSSLAARCLGDEALKVYDVLKQGNIDESRKMLSMLVGRETKNLSEKDIIKGVVETTAENTTDGVVSPLIFAIVGALSGIGAPLVYIFKAISTLDSMVGYKNRKYINLGMASAKLDDFANYIPAILTGLLIPLSALLCGMNYKKSFSIMLRDRRNHKSPNCGYSEAAVAGALGVRIGGRGVYFGEVINKPVIGDADREIEVQDIPRTVKLMYTTSLLALLFGVALTGIIIVL